MSAKNAKSKKLTDRYGLPYWIDLKRIPLTKAEMLRLFGTRCKDFDGLCPCCKAWRQWDKSGCADTVIDRLSLVKFLAENPNA